MDSDYTGNLDKRRSTGYVFILSQALVSWYYTLQSDFGDDRSRVHGSDKGCEGGDLASELDG